MVRSIRAVSRELFISSSVTVQADDLSFYDLICEYHEPSAQQAKKAEQIRSRLKKTTYDVGKRLDQMHYFWFFDNFQNPDTDDIGIVIGKRIGAEIMLQYVCVLDFERVREADEKLRFLIENNRESVREFSDRMYSNSGVKIGKKTLLPRQYERIVSLKF